MLKKIILINLLLFSSLSIFTQRLDSVYFDFGYSLVIPNKNGFDSKVGFGVYDYNGSIINFGAEFNTFIRPETDELMLACGPTIFVIEQNGLQYGFSFYPFPSNSAKYKLCRVEADMKFGYSIFIDYEFLETKYFYLLTALNYTYSNFDNINSKFLPYENAIANKYTRLYSHDFMINLKMSLHTKRKNNI
jgi:hypothetical protein